MNDRPSPIRPPARISRSGILAVGALVVAALILVGLSLRQPEVPVYSPTPLGGLGLAGPGPHLLTVDASDPDRWRYVELARGTVVENPDRLGWDLAFRRFEVRINGGPGFAGQAGARVLGSAPVDSVASVPRNGYAEMAVAGRDTTHALLDTWYMYSFTTHLLRPRDRTLVFRTARGRYAALRFLSYYCPGAQPGCVTIQYAFVEPEGDSDPL